MTKYLQNKKIILVMILVLLFELYFAVQSMSCIASNDKFHLINGDIKTKVFWGIYLDSNFPIFVIRIFHNQLIETFIAIISAFYHFWDIYFMISFISVIGTLLFGYGLVFFVTSNRNNKLILLSLVSIILTQLLIIVNLLSLNLYITLSILFVLYNIIIFYGLKTLFLKHKKFNIYVYILVIGLVVINLGWLNSINFL